MRPTMSILSPAPLVGPVRNSLRLSMFRRHVQPTPANTPFAPCHVRPRPRSTGDLIGELKPAGRKDPSVAISCVFVASELFEYFSPVSSAVKRSCLRDGKPAPRPHRKPLVSSTCDGAPRTMNPAYAETSA